ARIISNKWPGYGPQKNVGIEAAAFPYILSIDADEALDETLRESLLALKQMPMQGVYSFSRLNRYYGKFLRHGLEYPDIKPRLFPKDIVRWNENPVHETPEYSSPQKITRLDGF